jgi:hypothetical protein
MFIVKSEVFLLENWMLSANAETVYAGTVKSSVLKLPGNATYAILSRSEFSI